MKITHFIDFLSPNLNYYYLIYLINFDFNQNSNSFIIIKDYKSFTIKIIIVIIIVLLLNFVIHFIKDQGLMLGGQSLIIVVQFKNLIIYL
jgi:hypothetical protein